MEYTEDYNNREIYYIELLNTTNPDYGYNIASGGENPPIGAHTILSKEEVEEIKKLLLNQEKIDDIHAKFPSVTKGHIGKINRGVVWKDDNLTYPLKKENDNVVGIDIVEQIRYDLLNTFITQKEIAKKYNVARTTVTSINNGVREMYRDENYTYPLRKEKCLGGVFDDPNIVDEVIEMLQNTNIPTADISEKYQVGISSIYDIMKGKGRYFREGISYPIKRKRFKKTNNN